MCVCVCVCVCKFLYIRRRIEDIGGIVVQNAGKRKRIDVYGVLSKYTDILCMRQSLYFSTGKASSQSSKLSNRFYLSIIQQPRPAPVFVPEGSRIREGQLGQADGGAEELICRAYVSIRQHTSAYGSIRQHTSAYGGRGAELI